MIHLTNSEREVLDRVRTEGTMCAHQLTDAERRIATRLVRRGLLNSEHRSGCTAVHYY